MTNNNLLSYKVNQREFNLSTTQQLLVEAKLHNIKKNEIVEWLLWIFLGRLGFHRFYMDKPYGLGIFLLNIFGWILTFTFIFAFIGIPMICATWIWWLIDGLYINNWIKYNNDVKKNQAINEITNTNISAQSLEHFINHSNHLFMTQKIAQPKSHQPKHLANHPVGKHFLNHHSKK